MTFLFKNVGDMKNNSKVIYLVITAIIIALVGLFIFVKKSNDLNSDTPNANDSVTSNASNLPYGTPPKWAKSLIAINDNLENSREDKISKLVALLKQNESNPDALKAILISLTVLNPIEAADDLIPYLKNTNPKVQIATLGVLHNASLLTQKEHELKRSLSENEAIRKRIADAVNEFKVDPNTTDEVKQALTSIYIPSHSSLKDK
jgi:hypothetical protein